MDSEALTVLVGIVEVPYVTGTAKRYNNIIIK